MKKTLRKLSLHRETLQILAAPQIRHAAGGSVGQTVSRDVTGCPQCWTDIPPSYSCEDLC